MTVLPVVEPVVKFHLSLFGVERPSATTTPPSSSWTSRRWSWR
jgi:hypothetical protein